MISLFESTDSLLNNVFNASLNGIVVFEAVRNIEGEIVDFRYVFVNEAARKQAPILKETAVGMTRRELLQESDFLRIHSLCQMVLLTGQSHQGERYYPNMDEWFNTHFARLDDNRLVVTFINVTSFKKAVIKQQQEAELFQSILETTVNPVVVGIPILHNNGEIADFSVVLFNQAAHKAWYSGPPLCVGSTTADLLPPPEREYLLAVLRKAYLTSENQRFQYRYPNTDRWFSLTVQRFNRGVILNATDITEERQQQSMLRQMNLDLQQSNENLQQFAYIASHDLQEPLRKIHSFGNLLQTQFGSQIGPDGRDIIQRMQAASGRMTTLIRDLLTYSRLTTHRELFVPVSLGRILDEIIEDIDPLLLDGKATVDCKELPTVPGDASQLRQLFQNLIVNAVTFRHSDRPPYISVQCRTLESNEVPPGLWAQQQYVEISVIDNGIGFDERYTDRIFQMFQRLHGRSQYSGTGVGLAICKRVVENHQGIIVANSVPGEGATFKVILPI